MELVNVRDFYKSKGYIETYVPTFVENDVINSTCPPGGNLYNDSNLHHVASAEQGFIQLIKNGINLNGKYQTITACHRPLDKDRGELYQEWFIKLELFNSDSSKYKEIMSDAIECYTKFFGKSGLVWTLKTDIGLDIILSVDHSYELGSYGERDIKINKKNILFSYGTGFVPYRLEKAKKKLLEMELLK